MVDVECGADGAAVRVSAIVEYTSVGVYVSDCDAIVECDSY